MQISQPTSHSLDEMRATTSNEPLATVATIGHPTQPMPDEPVLKSEKSEGDTRETTQAVPRVPRQFTLPPWPTSQAGPEITAPSPGQRLVLSRTDQVTYDCYDQERGRPGLPPPIPTAQAREESADDAAETRPPDSTTLQGGKQPLEPVPLSKRMTVGQHVYDTQGAHVGKVAVRFPLYLLIERGWIFPQVYYIPLTLVAQVDGGSLHLSVSEATLKSRDFARVPLEINDLPASPASENLIDISGVSSLGMSPLTPAETGHYHYGPRGPGINTDAGGSYTQAEIDPRGRLRDHPVKLYITGKRLSSRNG